MIDKKYGDMYVVETERGKGIYLAEVETEEGSTESIIRTTTKNILDPNIIFTYNLEVAERLAHAIKDDIHSNNPRPLKVLVSVEIEEVI